MELTALMSGRLAALDPDALNLKQNSEIRQDLARARELLDAKYEQLRQASNVTAGRDYVLCTKAEYLAAGGDMRGNRLAVGWLYDMDSDVIKAEGCVHYIWLSDKGQLLVFLSNKQDPAAVRLPAAAWPYAELVLMD